MPVQVDIAGQGCGELGADRLFQHVALFQTPRFLLADIALMQSDVAAMANYDVDATALVLRAMDMLPMMEGLASGQDKHIVPSRLTIVLRQRGDGVLLRLPELGRIGEIAVLPEQVGGDLA